MACHRTGSAHATCLYHTLARVATTHSLLFWGEGGGVYDWKWIRSSGAAVIISKENRTTSTLIGLGTVMRSSAGTSQKVITNGSLTCGPNLDLDPHVSDGRGLI